MTLHRRFHDWSHATVLLGMLIYCLADERPGLIIVVIAVVASAWAMFRRAVVSPLPRWSINVLLLLATLNMSRQAWVSRFELQDVAISILGEYLIYLQLIKLFESCTPRDRAQLLVLNTMVVIGAVLTSVTLRVGLTLGMYVPMMLMTVMLFQLYAGQHRSMQRASVADERVLGAVAAAGPRMRRDLRRTLAAALVVISLGSALVFIIMPRDVGDEMLGRWPQAGSGARSGFTDEVQLGASGLISDSRNIVMELELKVHGIPMTTPINQYLRGAVLDSYDPDQGAWRRSARLSGEDQHKDGKLAIEDNTRGYESLPHGIGRFGYEGMPPGVARHGYEQHIRVRNKATEHLFALWKPEQVASLKRGPIYLNQRDGTLRMPNQRGYLAYSVRSYLMERSLGPLVDGVAEDALDSPFIEGPIRAYADRLLAEAGLTREPGGQSDERVLRLFEGYLRDNFEYTLEMAPAPVGVDPIEYFLLERREGHCEYFASAMVALSQSVGIPARIVTGYASNEIDPANETFIIREQHAHAWVEAPIRVVRTSLIRGRDEDPVEYVRAWKTFDPTPPSGLTALRGPKRGVLAWFRRVADRAEHVWVMSIVGYSSDHQESVLEGRVGSPLGFDWMPKFGTVSPRVYGRSALDGTIIFVGTFVVLMVIVFSAYRALVFVWSRLAPPVRRMILRLARPERARLESVYYVYGRMLEALGRFGEGKPESRPPLEHAEALGRRVPAAGESARMITLMYYATRFGGREVTDENIAAARGALRDLVDALQRKPA